MKLYIKQKVFSFGDKFTVYDENGEERYYAKGEVFSLGRKLHICDYQDNELAFIQQKLWTWMPRYLVLIGGEAKMEVIKEFTLLFPKYRIEGPGWEVSGQFWEHDYEATLNGQTVFSVHKQWMTWGDSYELDIPDPRNALYALAVVLIIDCITASQNNSASSVNTTHGD